MAGENHGAETTQEQEAAQEHGNEQAARDQPQVSGIDWEQAVAERDEKIAALEAQVVEAARNAETAEQLRGEIAELKAQGEFDRIDFKLQLAGVRNVTAARAMLGDYDGDVEALKEADMALRRCAHFQAPGRQDRASQRRYELRRGKDDEALSQAGRP